MKQAKQFTGIIEREEQGYFSLCPGLDIASQGETGEEARNNLIEVIEFFFETADPTEIASRLRGELFATHLEMTVRVAPTAI